MIFPPEPSKECVKVSHVIFECRVINHHPATHAIMLLRRNETVAFLSLSFSFKIFQVIYINAYIDSKYIAIAIDLFSIHEV